MRKNILAKSFIALAAIILFAGSFTMSAKPVANDDDINQALWDMMRQTNDGLESIGANYRVEVAEYFTGADEAGQTVFFNNRGNKQLPHHFVPGDSRRAGWSSGTDITYIVDQVDTEGVLGIAATTAAIDRAMTTWNNVQCSNITIIGLPPGGELGVAENGFGVGIHADITHAGFLPIFPPNVIGVTFTFVFVDINGFTDIDNNRKLDTAFREIYYSIFFAWGINSNVDVETVALHEAGHGLSQGHFGKLFRTDSNGKFHFAPRAVMNAGYTGVQQSIGKTDNGGHCSIWGSWPNN